MVTTGMEAAHPAIQRFLLVKEAASALGVSPMTVYRMIQDGQFPAVRVGARWVVPARAIGDLTAAPTPPVQALGPNLAEVPVVARILRVSPATLYRLIHKGGFPAVWLRGRVLVSGVVVDEMAATALTVRAAIDPKDWVHAHHQSEEQADGPEPRGADTKK